LLPQKTKKKKERKDPGSSTSPKQRKKRRRRRQKNISGAVVLRQTASNKRRSIAAAQDLLCSEKKEKNRARLTVVDKKGERRREKNKKKEGEENREIPARARRKRVSRCPILGGAKSKGDKLFFFAEEGRKGRGGQRARTAVPVDNKKGAKKPSSVGVYVWEGGKKRRGGGHPAPQVACRREARVRNRKGRREVWFAV